LSREEGVFLGVEPRYTLMAKANGFTLTFTGAQNLDPGLLTRLYVESFQVAGNSAARIAPVATRPEDFVDEWIGQPWSEVAQWSERTEN
jgi:hypothetical protein